MKITPTPNRRIKAAMWRSRKNPVIHASGPPGMKLPPGGSMLISDPLLFRSARARLTYLITSQHARIARYLRRKDFLGTPAAPFATNQAAMRSRQTPAPPEWLTNKLAAYRHDRTNFIDEVVRRIHHNLTCPR